MINIHELRLDNFVIVEFEDQERRGLVSEISIEDKMIRANTDDGNQDFWYELENVYPVQLSDSEMMHFKFEKEILPDGAVKYKKGSFRLVIPHEDDFSQLEMWYREDIRKQPNVHFVHQLQNQYHDMTKIYL